MVLADRLYAVFSRYARKNRIHENGKYRSAAGAARQLRKFYMYWVCDRWRKTDT
jgi:hypothetical protein